MCRALHRIVESGRFVLGPELAAFESELAGFLKVEHILGVNSGTDALVIGLKALGIGPGDEVITTPFTFFATVEAILRTGARPVFADIDPDTLCLSAPACERATTKQTKAILLVHLFGLCADLDRFTALCKERDLGLVEDAAQAIGSTWHGRPLGSFGHVSSLSFYPTKNLGALGDGGAVATSDERLAGRVRLLRSHGRDDAGRYSLRGHNSRLDDIQAAFLRTKLKRLETGNSRRRELAARYDDALDNLVRTVRGAHGCESNFHQYAILTPQRDGLRGFLAERGVETGVYYQTPAHLEPALNGGHDSLPVAEKACREVLSLPIRPSLTDPEQERIIALVRGFFGQHD